MCARTRSYSCNKLRTTPVPMLLFNGVLDPLSNISGLIERPIVPTTNKSMCVSYTPLFTDYKKSFSRSSQHLICFCQLLSPTKFARNDNLFPPPLIGSSLQSLAPVPLACTLFY